MKSKHPSFSLPPRQNKVPVVSFSSQSNVKMSSSSPHRVLIVGAGLTGALTGALLRRKLNQQIDITIWEKSRGSGGRMATNRSNSDAQAMVDIGAQYISATPQFAKTHER